MNRQGESSVSACFLWLDERHQQIRMLEKWQLGRVAVRLAVDGVKGFVLDEIVGLLDDDGEEGLVVVDKNECMLVEHSALVDVAVEAYVLLVEASVRFVGVLDVVVEARVLLEEACVPLEVVPVLVDMVVEACMLE